MQPLNFCRQIVRQANQLLNVPALDAVMAAQQRHVLDLAALSTKFMWTGGIRALVETGGTLKALRGHDRLRLPFPAIAVEIDDNSEEVPSRLRRLVLFAREREEGIAVSAAYHMPSNGFWGVMGADINLDAGWSGESTTEMRWTGDDAHGEADTGRIRAQLVLSFLSVIACSNVRVERLPARKIRKRARDPLPFDEYHVLTIPRIEAVANGSAGARSSARRSPREHVRRGHIRTLTSGRSMWINNCLVAATGMGGRVDKDYGLLSSGQG